VILVGGVAELYQGDLDLGRLAVEALAGEELGSGILVEELSYGGVAVAQRLEDLKPEALVLVGANARGREPGLVERREHGPSGLSPAELQLSVGDAVTGYVTIDLLIDVATALGTLPPTTVSIEVEPVSKEPSEQLTPGAQRGLERALALVRDEVATLRASASTA